MEEAKQLWNSGLAMEFFDSNTGTLLFTAPRGRSMEDFLLESRAHGWPSFRDSEVSFCGHVPCAIPVLLGIDYVEHHLPACFVVYKCCSPLGFMKILLCGGC